MASEKYERLTIDRICNEGCVNILEAFLERIGIEYRTALQAWCEEPSNEDFQKRYEESKSFILSDYFKKLTNLDGEAIVEALNRNYIQG